MTKDEAQRLAKELEGVIADVEQGDGFDDVCLDTVKYVRDALLMAQPEQEPVAYSYTSRITGAQGFSHHPMPRFIDSESWDIKPLYTQQYTYIAPTHQKPFGWKLVPIEPTNEMLKAMDECSTEGYDERLLAGHASSVYMAAVDVAPTPPKPEPVIDKSAAVRIATSLGWEPKRKPLTEPELHAINPTWPAPGQEWGYEEVLAFARAIEAAHGIKE